MNETKGHWVDLDGNCWSKGKYSLELARKLSRTLVNCKGMTDCYDCSECVGLVGESGVDGMTIE